MIFGSRESLAQVATSINDALAPDALSSREVASLDLSTGSEDFVVSLHIDDPSQPSTNVPRDNRAFWVLLAMLPFAIIGLISVFKWAASAF